MHDAPTNYKWPAADTMQIKMLSDYTLNDQVYKRGETYQVPKDEGSFMLDGLLAYRVD